MTGLSTYLKNALFNGTLRTTTFTAPTNVYLSLHTGDPGITGANEVTGGSYARQLPGFGAPTAGVGSNAGTIDFTGMPAVATPGVVAFGLWDAVTTGNCLWTGWIGSIVGSFTGDATTDLITSIGHGLTTGNTVIFEARDGKSLPTGLSSGTIYYVIASGLTVDVFKVSATSGGSAIDITVSGEGVAYKAQPKVVANAGDTVEITAGQLSASLV